jgi:hypothetical protein
MMRISDGGASRSALPAIDGAATFSAASVAQVTPGKREMASTEISGIMAHLPQEVSQDRQSRRDRHTLAIMLKYP